jgi:hypothetical protein
LQSTQSKTKEIIEIIEKIDSSIGDEDDTAPLHRVLNLHYLAKVDRSIPSQFLYWVPSQTSDVEAFLNFVRLHNFSSKVKSLVILSHRELNDDRSGTEDSVIYREVKTLWRSIFTTLSPNDIVVAAPPSTMAALSGGQARDFDGWLFQMPYHYLRLRKRSCDFAECEDHGTPGPIRRAKEVFLFNMHPWTYIGYNEGTFLRAYGHYEYQWKKAPYVFPSLLERLMKEQNSWRAPRIEKVEYIAIYPYASHVEYVTSALGRSNSIRELKVKFADPDLLGDTELMGKAQPSDLYEEWSHCYRRIDHDFLRKGCEGAVLISQDTKHTMLRDQVGKLARRMGWEPEEQDGVEVWTRGLDSDRT